MTRKGKTGLKVYYEKLLYNYHHLPADKHPYSHLLGVRAVPTVIESRVLTAPVRFIRWKLHLVERGPVNYPKDIPASDPRKSHYDNLRREQRVKELFGDRRD